MERRRFLTLGGLAAVASMVRWRQPKPVSDVFQTFYLAGSRFFGLPHDLVQGDQLWVFKRVHKGEPCFVVCTLGGTELGFLPKKLVQSRTTMNSCEARVMEIDRHALPWKRIKIALMA